MIEIPKFTTECLLNLKDDESNPNVMTKEQIRSVANSIKKYGFLIPIIVNKDNIIIDGHQRKKAAEILDLEEVPIIRLDVDQIDGKILKQILNKLKGQHNPDLDLEEFKSIFESQGDLECLKELVAMDNKEIQDILKNIDSDLKDSDFRTDRGNEDQLYISRTLQFTPLEIETYDKFVKSQDRPGKKIYEMIANEDKR